MISRSTNPIKMLIWKSLPYFSIDQRDWQQRMHAYSQPFVTFRWHYALRKNRFCLFYVFFVGKEKFFKKFNSSTFYAVNVWMNVYTYYVWLSQACACTHSLNWCGSVANMEIMMKRWTGYFMICYYCFWPMLSIRGGRPCFWSVLLPPLSLLMLLLLSKKINWSSIGTKTQWPPACIVGSRHAQIRLNNIRMHHVRRPILVHFMVQILP